MDEHGRVKVVRIVSRLNVGGAARHAIILSGGMVADGFDTILVHGSLADDEASLEDLLVSPDIRHVQVSSLGRRVSLRNDLSALIRLTRIVFAERPDIVDTHMAKAGALGRVAALIYNLTRSRRARCAVIHTFHGHVFEGYFGPAVNRTVVLAERALGRITDRVIAISPRQRTDIVERHRIVESGRVAVVALGLDLEDLFGLPPAAGRGQPDDAPVFGFVGRLVPIKDPETLLKAFVLVRDRVPGARLHLVGDGELRDAVSSQAATMGIADAVALLGWRKDLRAIYAGIDVLVLSSRQEGTPFAVIEAMAAARPVVATDVGGVADILVDGVTGLLVSPQDPSALADAMIRLALDAPLRGRIGAAAREHAAAYRSGRLLADMGRLYREVLEEKRGSGKP
ncbi:MAG TPA: glycosyltransferase family 4 protein [Vicinamibacterales bacterium]